jgi:5-methylcytosine-specific restriction endonuclease McrA
MSLAKNAYPALALNADHQVLDVWPWQDAVLAYFRDSVYVVRAYPRFIASPTTKLQLPSVVALRHYAHPRRLAAFTRRNVYVAYAQFRAGTRFWRCALCGGIVEADDLTFDHLTPRAQGGQSSWDNVCLAHSACNNRKGNQTLAQAGLTLKVGLLRPSESVMALARIRHDFDGLVDAVPTDWRDHLGRPGDPGYWDAALEP